MERKAEYCLTQIFHYLVNGLAAIVFFCCIAYSGYALWDNWSILKEPDQVREDLIRYKPANEEELSYSLQDPAFHVKCPGCIFFKERNIGI